jgi:hypothetical protein
MYLIFSICNFLSQMIQCDKHTKRKRKNLLRLPYGLSLEAEGKH